jgi:hypothetical protein
MFNVAAHVSLHVPCLALCKIFGLGLKVKNRPDREHQARLLFWFEGGRIHPATKWKRDSFLPASAMLSLAAASPRELLSQHRLFVFFSNWLRNEKLVIWYSTQASH